MEHRSLTFARTCLVGMAIGFAIFVLTGDQMNGLFLMTVSFIFLVFGGIWFRIANGRAEKKRDAVIAGRPAGAAKTVWDTIAITMDSAKALKVILGIAKEKSLQVEAFSEAEGKIVLTNDTGLIFPIFVSRAEDGQTLVQVGAQKLFSVQCAGDHLKLTHERLATQLRGALFLEA